MSLTKVGKVWLVGAGPGDAGLFTRKGYDVLQQADVVVYDALVGDGGPFRAVHAPLDRRG